jgi:hypothetical protein
MRCALKLGSASVLWLALHACGPSAPAPRSLVVTLEARTPTGEPVANTRAWAAGRPLGQTDIDGRLIVKLEGREGERVLLSWACPSAYRTRGDQRVLTLEAPAQRSSQPSTLRAQCEPLERLAALVVRLTGAPATGLPIRVRNEIVARTDEHGVAHALLRVRPSSPLGVALDTSQHPELVPRDPVETFQLGDDDSILLFERTLSAAPRPALKAKRRVRREPARRLPYRIE